MTFINLFLSKSMAFITSPETLSFLVNNRFLLILLVVILSKIKSATYSSLWLSALINIPGTFLHETMHFIVGYLLNAYPTSFTLLPKKNGNQYIMGSVGFRNISFYNAIPAALAPLLLLPLGYYFNRWYFLNIDVNIFNYIMYILLQTIIVENALPSSTDFRVAFSYPLGILLYGTLAVLGIALL